MRREMGTIIAVGRTFLVVAWFGSVLALVGPPTAEAGPTLVGTISRPNLKPRSVAVYAAGNKVFVGDDTTGNVYIYDGTTLAELGSVSVGAGLAAMVLDETSGKLYAASLFACRIAVIDAASGTLLRDLEARDSFNQPRYCNVLGGRLTIDPNLRKVYALSIHGLFQIDIVSDTETLIPGFGGGGFEGIGVNTTTNEVFVTRYIQNVVVIVNGRTLQQTSVPGLGGAGTRIGVDSAHNKAYIGYCGVHPNGRSAFCAYNRSNNSSRLLDVPNDATDIFYNPMNGRGYSSVEVDRVASIIDGATDASVNLSLTGPRLAVGFRFSTAHVYYVGQRDVTVLRESANLLPQVAAVLPVTNASPSSVLKQAIAVNQNTGRIYVINDTDALNFVTVIQDEAITEQVGTPVNFRTTSIVGNNVTFAWMPTSGMQATTGYILEGGLAPGSVLGSLSMPSTAATFTTTLPTGTFFLRLYAVAGSTRSTASNEIQVRVNVPEAPGPPSGLTGSATGSELSLSWVNAASGGTPTEIVLAVTGAATTSIALPGAATSFAYATVPPGTYTFTVSARNAGGSSAPSNAVTLSFPGPCVAPQPPTNLQIARSGNVLTITWGLPASGPAPTGYTLIVSGAFNGSIATTTRALSGNVPAGTYTMRVTATNACGTSAPTAAQTVTVP